VLKAGLETRTDGIIGTSLLLTGFILQLLGANGYNYVIAAQVLLAFLSLFLLLYFMFFRKVAIKYQLKKAKEFEEKWNSESSE
jgi:uncharacterized protein (DUF58 family)